MIVRVIVWSAVVLFLGLPSFFFFDYPDEAGAVKSTVMFFAVWSAAILAAAAAIAIPDPPKALRHGLCVRIGLWFAAIGLLEASAVLTLLTLVEASDFFVLFFENPHEDDDDDDDEPYGPVLLSFGITILTALVGFAGFLLLARIAQARVDDSKAPPAVYVLAEVV